MGAAVEGVFCGVLQPKTIIVSRIHFKTDRNKGGTDNTYGAPTRSDLLFLMGSDMATDQGI